MTWRFSRRSNELSRQELARLAAPVCYALRNARGSRRRVAKERQCCPAVPQMQPSSPSSARRIRPRDAKRVDAHRAKLSAEGLRCKAPPFVPKDYIFLGPGPGWMPAKRGRRGRKALRAAHRDEKIDFTLNLRYLDVLLTWRATTQRQNSRYLHERCRFRVSCAQPGARFPSTPILRCVNRLQVCKLAREIRCHAR